MRPYLETDFEACLTIFDSNSFNSMGQSEREQFEEFLRKHESPYFVMDHEGSVVGSGGYILDLKVGEAKLVWGMIRQDSQKLGLGRFLLLFRLREIGKQGNISMVRAEAPPHTSGFFENQGFKIGGTAPNGFASGVDRIILFERLTVCRQTLLRIGLTPKLLILIDLVRPVGFEPTTFCSGGKRSIQAELRAHFGRL